MIRQQSKWLKDPHASNYPAAESYLSLILSDEKVAKLLRKLRKAPIRLFKSKDIFRASSLSRLGVSNSHVRADRRKLQAGQPLSPLLLVRDSKHGKVIIADGYHRLCAVYGLDEDAVIPCKIV